MLVFDPFVFCFFNSFPMIVFPTSVYILTLISSCFNFCMVLGFLGCYNCPCCNCFTSTTFSLLGSFWSLCSYVGYFVSCFLRTSFSPELFPFLQVLPISVQSLKSVSSKLTVLVLLCFLPFLRSLNMTILIQKFPLIISYFFTSLKTNTFFFCPYYHIPFFSLIAFHTYVPFT